MVLIMKGGGGDATEEFLTSCQVWRGRRADILRRMRVLVVEDERKVAKALRDGLEAERYDVSVAASGEDGFFLVNREIFDLVLLDLMLPRRNGIEVLTTLRKRGLQTPVLILTAKDAVEDRVHGLDSGADDYLVKPFAILWHRLCGIGSWGAPWGAVSENGRLRQGAAGPQGGAAAC